MTGPRAWVRVGLALYRAKDAGRNQVRLYASAQEPQAPQAGKESDEATDACP
jgi:hypothetical protein